MLQTFQGILLVFHVLVAVALVSLILLQHGKGADAGAAFGSGASATVFGARGSANFLSRSTAALAVLFFVVSLTLAYIAANRPRTTDSVVESVTETVDAPPAVPESAVPESVEPAVGDLPPAPAPEDLPPEQ